MKTICCGTVRLAAVYEIRDYGPIPFQDVLTILVSTGATHMFREWKLEGKLYKNESDMHDFFTENKQPAL